MGSGFFGFNISTSIYLRQLYLIIRFIWYCIIYLNRLWIFLSKKSLNRGNVKQKSLLDLPLFMSINFLKKKFKFYRKPIKHKEPFCEYQFNYRFSFYLFQLIFNMHIMDDTFVNFNFMS